MNTCGICEKYDEMMATCHGCTHDMYLCSMCQITVYMPQYNSLPVTVCIHCQVKNNWQVFNETDFFQRNKRRK